MVSNNKRQMGFGYNKDGLQIGVCEKAPIFRCKRDTCSEKESEFDRFRNSKTCAEKCSRNCTQKSDRCRFLQYIVSGNKEKWRNAPSYQSEASEQVSEEVPLQNGHNEKSSKSSSRRRLEHKLRPKRCLFPHRDLQKASKVSTVLLQVSSIPISSTLFWSNSSSSGFHKNNGSSSCLSSKAKSQDSYISRRLVRFEPDSYATSSESNISSESPFRARFHYQQKEIQSRTFPECDIYWGSVSFEERPCISNSRESIRFESSSNEYLAGPELSQGLLGITGEDSLMYRLNSKRQIVHETNTASFAGTLESAKVTTQFSSSMYGFSKITSSVVVTGSKHNEGLLFSSTAMSNYLDHRCQHVGRLGRSHEQSVCTGTLVPIGETSACKLSRNGGCHTISETFSSKIAEQKCSDSLRQYHSSPIHQQARGHEIPVSVSESMGTMVDGIGEWDYAEGSTYYWQGEHTSRLSEQNSGEKYRVVSEQNSCEEVICCLGYSNDGPVCNIGEQTNTSVLLLDTTASGICFGCPVNCMAEHVCLCFSTNSVSPQSVVTYETVPLHTDTDSAKLAETALVPSSVADVSCQTSDTAFNTRSSVTREGQNMSPQPRDSRSDCMATINKRLATEGFSENSRKLLTASWRKGTQRDYRSKFRSFCSWCSEQQIDPYTASLKDCVNFLTYKYHKGAAYRTIAGYRSMMSSVLPPVDRFPVGQHPYVIRLLRGVYNERPPEKRLVPEWDLLLVLGMLKETPFEPLKRASIKHLTWKTCFLIAVTSFRRCSDLQSLRLGEGCVNVQSKGVTFVRQGLSKQDRPNHTPSHVFIPAFSDNKKLDPKRCLAVYLKRTEEFRRQDEKDETQLFLSVNKPHKPVSRQTISKWIVNTIKFAYKQKHKTVDNVKGHSTRSIGPSWALFKGVSMRSIMESADWARESTFVKHYLKTVSVDFLKE